MNIFIYSILLCVHLKFVYCITHANFDISSVCNNNLKADYFLTSGMGYVDAIVFILSSKNNCTINLYASNTTVQIIVLETLQDSANICRGNSIMISDGSDRKYDACGLNNGKQTRRFFMEVFNNNIITIALNGTFSNVLKLTATTAKVLRRDEETCMRDGIKCRIRNDTVCIHKELQCDGNINCGYHDLFDESNIVCKGISIRTIGTVLLFIILFLIILLIIYKLCLKYLPTVPSHFVQIPNLENNTLIVTPNKIPSVQTKLSLKQIAIKGDGENVSNISMHNNSDQGIEKEIHSVIYSDTSSNFIKKKRLTTNSPIFRKSRNFKETVILSPPSSTSASNVSSNDSLYTLFYERRKRNPKRRRHVEV